MSRYDERELKVLAWCFAIGCAMVSFYLETCLPLVIGVIAILLGRYTANFLSRR